MEAQLSTLALDVDSRIISNNPKPRSPDRNHPQCEQSCFTLNTFGLVLNLLEQEDGVTVIQSYHPMSCHMLFVLPVPCHAMPCHATPYHDHYHTRPPCPAPLHLTQRGTPSEPDAEDAHDGKARRVTSIPPILSSMNSSALPPLHRSSMPSHADSQR